MPPYSRFAAFDGASANRLSASPGRHVRGGHHLDVGDRAPLQQQNRRQSMSSLEGRNIAPPHIVEILIEVRFWNDNA